MKIILSVLWFFLPAGLGNLAPILANKIPFLKKYTYPLDFGKKFRNRRIFGDHKTIRGLVAGVFIGIITVYVQVFLYNHFQFFRNYSFIDYNKINPFILGFIAAFGALFGDSVKSFFKRQLNIPSGKSWFPFDQIDYIIGGILFTALYVELSFNIYFYLFIIWFLLHILSTFIGWLLRLKDDPI
jgi:CDP-2,3-bis-(O-geranylgeranyl)-sn-glycerol synthase